MIDSKSSKIIFAWLIIGIIGIFVLNLLFGGSTSGSAIIPALVIFAVVGAIGEEMFFLSMQSITWEILHFSKKLKSIKFIKEIISILFIVGLFTFFHTVVYVGHLAALAFVTGLRVITSIQFQFTRRQSISILTHLINNALAISGVLATFGGIFIV